MDYFCQFHSNWFLVEDEDRFAAWIDKYPVDVQQSKKEPKRVRITSDGELPDTENTPEGFLGGLRQHLDPTGACVLTEVGYSPDLTDGHGYTVALAHPSVSDEVVEISTQAIAKMAMRAFQRAPAAA